MDSDFRSVDKDRLVARAAVDAADVKLHVVADVLDAVAMDLEMLVVIDLFDLIADFVAVFFAADGLMPVVADVFARIVLHADVHVFFAVDENLLGALFILEAEFVVAFAAFAGVGFDVAFGFFVGQRVGRASARRCRPRR